MERNSEREGGEHAMGPHKSGVNTLEICHGVGSTHTWLTNWLRPFHVQGLADLAKRSRRAPWIWRHLRHHLLASILAADTRKRAQVCFETTLIAQAPLG